MITYKGDKDMYSKEQIHEILSIEDLIAHGRELDNNSKEQQYNIDGSNIYIVVGDNNNVNSFNGRTTSSGVGHVEYNYNSDDMTACELCAENISYETCSQCVHWEQSILFYEEQRILKHEKSIERRNTLLQVLWTTAKWTVFLPFTLIARESKIRSEMYNNTSLIEDRTEYIDVEVIDEDTTPQLSHREVMNQKALYTTSKDRAELNKKADDNYSSISIYELIN